MADVEFAPEGVSVPPMNCRPRQAGIPARISLGFHPESAPIDPKKRGMRPASCAAN